MELDNEKIKILVIDDEVDIVELLCDEFVDQGFIVDSAFSGDKAIEKLSDFQPDVILCDYRMPGMSGLQVLEQAKIKNKNPNSFLFYLVTGQTDMSEDEMSEVGIHRCVSKPFDIFKLIDGIHEDILKR